MLLKIDGSETAYVDDAAIVDIMDYANSECLGKQAKILAPARVPRDREASGFRFRISRITSLSNGYQVDFQGPFPDVVIDIKRPRTPGECKFELIKLGGRVY